MKIIDHERMLENTRAIMKLCYRKPIIEFLIVENGLYFVKVMKTKCFKILHKYRIKNDIQQINKK